MSKDPFYQDLASRSQQKQETFMQHIAQRLGRPKVTEAPAHPYQGAPDFWQTHELDLEERLTLLTDNWQQVGGHAQRCPDLSTAQSYIVQTAQEMKAKHIIRHQHPTLNDLGLEDALLDCDWTVWNGQEAERGHLLSKAAGADVGVVVADYAVATTGSVVLMSDPFKGRSVSLLPTALMILIPASVVKTRLGEVMTDISQYHPETMPAGIHFISGPSRSADIENDLTIGVHGPGVVHALVVEDISFDV
ncbi:LutC/YkgG family protein [Caldalkalibacillus salinus]|uniref:LutC/YkgG family protein n=1 Tax=Caldalkalibacillus salinus TaxID=2803787 RepID=UPI001922E3B5|nr:lactate utilization protein C [Caldalkalibacillus salinus]